MRFPDIPIMNPVFDLFKRLELKLLTYYFADRWCNTTRCFNDIVRQLRKRCLRSILSCY